SPPAVRSCRRSSRPFRRTCRRRRQTQVRRPARRRRSVQTSAWIGSKTYLRALPRSRNSFHSATVRAFKPCPFSLIPDNSPHGQIPDFPSPLPEGEGFRRERVFPGGSSPYGEREIALFPVLTEVKATGYPCRTKWISWCWAAASPASHSPAKRQSLEPS